GEMAKKSTFNWTLVFWLLTSYIVSSVIYLVGSFWWILFVCMAIAVAVFFIIRIYNKNRKVKKN
ncbi:MAG: hypothetical protein IJB32_03825, partial [Clostridia bacterium]|nr:hypothetical protein [Clostridia bacterium]